MPILASEIVWRYSGGAANVDKNESYRGAMSTAGGGVITTATLNNLFDNVTGPESTTGMDDYRLIYLYNANNPATTNLTLTNTKVWIDQNTPSTDDFVEIWTTDSTAPIGSDSTISMTSENSTPGGFSATPNSAASPAVIGNIPAGSKKAIWIHRKVSPGAAAYTTNNFILGVSGETLA